MKFRRLWATEWWGGEEKGKKRIKDDDASGHHRHQSKREGSKRKWRHKSSPSSHYSLQSSQHSDMWSGLAFRSPIFILNQSPKLCQPFTKRQVSLPLALRNGPFTLFLLYFILFTTRQTNKTILQAQQWLHLKVCCHIRAMQRAFSEWLWSRMVTWETNVLPKGAIEIPKWLQHLV